MNARIENIFNDLANAESAFIGREFLAPVIRGHGVAVQIAGVRCNLSVDPIHFSGWGVFRANSHSHARLVRQATPLERRAYLRLLPTVSMIVCATSANETHAVHANPVDDRVDLAGPVPLRLRQRADLFDTVVSRFDGAQFWFDEVDARVDPSIAAYLRRQLAQMTDPNSLSRPGLTRGQRIAYAIQYVPRAKAILAEERRRADYRLMHALAHAGADMTDFTELPDHYRVSFNVDGQRHTSTVSKNDLTVRSAGICLSGRDRDFDLDSLVSVLREGATIGRF